MKKNTLEDDRDGNATAAWQFGLHEQGSGRVGGTLLRDGEAL